MEKPSLKGRLLKSLVSLCHTNIFVPSFFAPRCCLFFSLCFASLRLWCLLPSSEQQEGKTLAVPYILGLQHITALYIVPLEVLAAVFRLSRVNIMLLF